MLKRAAGEDNAEARFLVGVAYAQGCGVPPNDREAAKWFHQAARARHPRAMASLGFMYARGRGVRRDVVLAYQYLDQAAGHGDPLARDMVEWLRREMTPQQVREAERRVAERRLG